MTSYLLENEAEKLQNGVVHLAQIHDFGRLLSTGGGAGGSFPPKVLLKKKLQLFQIKIFFDDDFKESVKVTNVQKCDFSQS